MQTTDSSTAATAHIGVAGLAVMGRNLARNLARHAHSVAPSKRTQSRTDDLVRDCGHERDVVPSQELEDVVVDRGHAHVEDTRRREAALRDKGAHEVGTGISGGELGPSKVDGAFRTPWSDARSEIFAGPQPPRAREQGA